MSGSQIGRSLAFSVIASSGSTLFGGTGSVLILKKLPDSAQVFLAILGTLPVICAKKKS